MYRRYYDDAHHDEEMITRLFPKTQFELIRPLSPSAPPSYQDVDQKAPLIPRSSSRLVPNIVNYQPSTATIKRDKRQTPNVHLQSPKIISPSPSLTKCKIVCSSSSSEHSTDTPPDDCDPCNQSPQSPRAPPLNVSIKL